MVRVVVLYDSRGGLIEALAEEIERGIVEAGADCLRRRVEETDVGEVVAADGLVVGSPNWTGITAKLKEWFDYSGDLWETGELAGKVGAAFTAGYSRSAGIEATLLQIIHLLLGHGMVVVGLPWSHMMRRSGSYYGATAHGEVTDEDRAQARTLGRRVAETAMRLDGRTEDA